MREFRQLHVSHGSDLPQFLPERILEADARLVAADANRALDHWRFHSLPFPRRYDVTGVAAGGLGWRALRRLVLSDLGGMAAVQIVELLSQCIFSSPDQDVDLRFEVRSLWMIGHGEPQSHDVHTVLRVDLDRDPLIPRNPRSPTAVRRGCRQWRTRSATKQIRGHRSLTRASRA